ncbi:MAG: hypothetical protein ABIQ40_16935 [Bacteroidia bacterium]
MKTTTEKPGELYQVPPDGSLGLLAIGYRGFIAWQEAKKKFKENKPAQEKNNEPEK